MRRRLPEVVGLPPELTDPELWPLCLRWDGGMQRCSCWWAQAQSKWLESGGLWPGGEQRMMGDLIDVVRGPYECRQPFDGTTV